MKETEFSPEYFEPGHRRLKATAVEEKHNKARNRSWSRKTTLLSKNGNKVTIHEILRHKRKFRRVSGSDHLDLVNHKKVGEMETINTVEEGWKRTPRGRNYWVSKKERITEKWENKVYSSDTTIQTLPNPVSYFRAMFKATNDDPTVDKR